MSVTHDRGPVTLKEAPLNPANRPLRDDEFVKCNFIEAENPGTCGEVRIGEGKIMLNVQTFTVVKPPDGLPVMFPQCYVDLEIQGKLQSVLLDTGASTSIIARKVAKELGFVIKSLPDWKPAMRLKGIENRKLPPLRTYVLIGVRILENEYIHPVTVMDRDDGIFLLGMDFLNGKPFCYDFKQGKISGCIEAPTIGRQYPLALQPMIHTLIEWKPGTMRTQEECVQLRRELRELPMVLKKKGSVIVNENRHGPWAVIWPSDRN